MRNISVLAQKEFKAYFVSPMAYAILVFYLLITGFIFFVQKSPTPAAADLAGLPGSMIFLLIFVSPIVTMRLIAEEVSSGTMELLMASPVRTVDIVLGKYLGALGFYVVMLLLTLEFPIFVELFGDPDRLPILAAYIGVFLAGASFLAVGLFTSALTRSQVAAALFCLVILLVFWLIGFLATSAPPGHWLGQFLRYISVFERLQDFEEGTLDSRSVLYFVSIAAFFLYGSVLLLQARR